MFISHASKIILKTLQARLHQYVNRKLPDIQAGFKKCRGTRDQITNNCCIIKKARKFHKNIYVCFIDYDFSIVCILHCVDHNKLWNILQLSRVQFFATPWTVARQASLSITNSQSLLKLMSIELVMPPNHLILCHPLLVLPSVCPNVRVFSNESFL